MRRKGGKRLKPSRIDRNADQTLGSAESSCQSNESNSTTRFLWLKQGRRSLFAAAVVAISGALTVGSATPSAAAPDDGNRGEPEPESESGLGSLYQHGGPTRPADEPEPEPEPESGFYDAFGDPEPEPESVAAPTPDYGSMYANGGPTRPAEESVEPEAVLDEQVDKVDPGPTAARDLFQFADSSKPLGLADALSLQDALEDGELNPVESAALSFGVDQSNSIDSTRISREEMAATTADGITEARAIADEAGIDQDQFWADVSVPVAKGITPYGSGEDLVTNVREGNIGAAALSAGAVVLEFTPAKPLVIGSKAVKASKLADAADDVPLAAANDDIATTISRPNPALDSAPNPAPNPARHVPTTVDAPLTAANDDLIQATGQMSDINKTTAVAVGGLGAAAIGTTAFVLSDISETDEPIEPATAPEVIVPEVVAPGDLDPSVNVPEDVVPIVGDPEIPVTEDPISPVEVVPLPDQTIAAPEISPLQDYWAGTYEVFNPWDPPADLEADSDVPAMAPLEQEDPLAPIPYGPNPDQVAMPGLAPEVLNGSGEGEESNGQDASGTSNQTANQSANENSDVDTSEAVDSSESKNPSPTQGNDLNEEFFQADNELRAAEADLEQSHRALLKAAAANDAAGKEASEKAYLEAQNELSFAAQKHREIVANFPSEMSVEDIRAGIERTPENQALSNLYGAFGRSDAQVAYYQEGLEQSRKDYSDAVEAGDDARLADAEISIALYQGWSDAVLRRRGELLAEFPADMSLEDVRTAAKRMWDTEDSRHKFAASTPNARIGGSINEEVGGFVTASAESTVHKQGDGGKLFNEMLEAFQETSIPLAGVQGNWGEDSTNLEVFRDKIQKEGLSPEEAALETPTGKWASRAGFGQVEIVENHSETVIVNFRPDIETPPSPEGDSEPGKTVSKEVEESSLDPEAAGKTIEQEAKLSREQALAKLPERARRQRANEQLFDEVQMLLVQDPTGELVQDDLIGVYNEAVERLDDARAMDWENWKNEEDDFSVKSRGDITGDVETRRADNHQLIRRNSLYQEYEDILNRKPDAHGAPPADVELVDRITIANEDGRELAVYNLDRQTLQWKLKKPVN